MNDTPQDSMREIFALFRAEGAEHVNRITELLLAWERGSIDAAGLEELFRAAHSLKGAASTIGVDNLAEIAHAMEDVFGAAKRGEIKYDAAVSNEILAALDAVTAILERAAPGEVEEDVEARAVAARVKRLLEAGTEGEGPPPAETGPAEEKKTVTATLEPDAGVVRDAVKGKGRPKGEETVRLPVDKLDAVINRFSELWEEKFRNDDFALRMHEAALSARAASKALNEAADSYRSRADAADFSRQVERAAAALGAVHRELRTVDFDFEAAGKRFELDLASFGDELGRLRMAPLRALFRSFRRPVRDLAVKLGKNVQLDIIGEDNELDKAIIEFIKDPLNHILRNAVDHGVEDEETRRAAGKPPAGRVLISSTRVGSRLLIEVEDDGRGIDLDAVKEVALAAGVIRPEAAEAMSPEEVARLIFEPGVTTKAEVTEFGGRGVGLDVVTANVAALGGTFDVWSEAGVGTRVSIQIPLTIATARGMLVEAAGAKFIVPSSAIRRVDLVSAADFETVEGKLVLRDQGRVYAAGELSTILEMGDDRGLESRPTVLLLSSPAGEAVLIVSAVWGEGEFLTKDLGAAASLMPYFSAAHVTGEGEVVLILNVDALVRDIIRAEVALRAAAAPAAEVRKRSVLLVADSLTTRALEKNILVAAGYEVAVATDGVEALQVLAEVPCDIAIVDLQMPRMDGFELTRRIRASAEYRDLPVVVVTSLDAERDMVRGLEAGADAYIRKSHFDQRELLSVIEQFI